MCLHGDVFDSWDSNLGSLVLMWIFLIKLAVQVQAISNRYRYQYMFRPILSQSSISPSPASPPTPEKGILENEDVLRS